MESSRRGSPPVGAGGARPGATREGAMCAKRSHLQAAAAACLVALSAYASVAAPILPVSQARSVSATASHPLGTPSSDSESAPDFGPFAGSASAVSGPIGDRLIASVTHDSTIGADRIDLLVDGLALLALVGGVATVSSSFDVTFDLLVESDYSLFYDGHRNQFVSTGGTLSDDQGVIVDLHPLTARIGTLSPGRYRLE